MSNSKVLNEPKYLKRSLCGPQQSLKKVHVPTIITHQHIIGNSLLKNRYVKCTSSLYRKTK